MRSLLSFCTLVLPSLVGALTISEINGNGYISPYKGQTVSGVQGLVTAKGPYGFYLRSTSPDWDDATSESIYVYGSSTVSKVSVGDIITLSGKVAEYRSSATYVYMAEITSASVTVESSGNKVSPIVIGRNRKPPTKQFSALDNGDIFSLPNNASQLSNANPTLKPHQYGMDFWESLSGELVTLKDLRAIAKPNQYGDTWVLGSWAASGENKRGGLTMTTKDANPEAILIGSPLDGTDNPTDTKLGDRIADITGVVTPLYGYYVVAPLTALTVTGSHTTQAAPVNFVSDGTCRAMTVGSYNVENLTPTSSTMPQIADHIVNYLKSPTVMFLQEIQDNSGTTNNGVVSANVTLATLVEHIAAIGGVEYAFTEIAPIDGENGGAPGGNIRVAYLYNPKVVRLRNENPGSSTDANEVLPGAELKYNPGLIAPTDAAWEASRKPLVAAWETLNGKNKFFTVNVHFTSKGGGTSIEGDARPPVNGGVDQRIAQAERVAEFVSAILAEDKAAKIIASGDFNEFTFAPPMQTLMSKSGLLDLDKVAGIPETERYTYIFDMNCQQLDHMFVSKAVALARPRMEHVHVNTWVSYDDQVSDHDPTVALFNLCAPASHHH